MSELPESWVPTTLGQVVSYADNETTDPADMSPEAWLLELEDIERDTGKVLERKTVGERVPKSSKNRFQAGDVLYGKLRPYLNKVVRADQDGFCSSEIIAISPGLLDKNYLFYSMRSPSFIEYVSSVSHGMRMPRLGTQQAKSAPFVLPPQAEQIRIAAKLDELLAQVDTLKARIDAIPALLKRFRQSVLAAAVSGRLTEEWRARNSCPAWSEIKLEDMLAGTKDGICRGPFGSSIKKEFFVPAGHKVYEQKNAIRDSSFIGEYFVDEGKYKELERFSVRPGDFIVSCAGTLGRISLLPVGAPAGLINQALIRIRTNKDLVLDEYFLVLFRSPVFQEKLIVGARGGAMQNLASTKEIKALDIYCPAIPEQTEIVRRVEQLFAFADQLEAKVASAKSRIDYLTQSILAKAFRGELVPQDPNDEPASVLLERIQAQRAAAPKVRRGRKASV